MLLNILLIKYFMHDITLSAVLQFNMPISYHTLVSNCCQPIKALSTFRPDLVFTAQ